MSHTISHRNQNLISRNEGKIKSYESCFDIRAWNHDIRVRDRYLREWIKSDMPICFIPVCTLTKFLKIMNCKSRGKTIPQCHPNCKSKILLESICTSCHAIKECLKANKELDKYNKEDTFETSHWPCERCLDALKSIKIFWRIIVEKIFNIQISSKNDEFDIHSENYSQLHGVKSIAKIWEKDLVQQATFLKNVTPILKDSFSHLNALKDIKYPLMKTTQSDDKFYDLKNTINSESIPQTRKAKDKKSRISNIEESNKRGLLDKCFTQKPSPKRLTKSISVKVRTTDVACSTCERESEELKTHNANLKKLQNKFNAHKIEIKRLQEENLWLKGELQNSRISQRGNSGIYISPIINPDTNTIQLKSIENNTEEQTDNESAKNIDSEMIITMKNWPNKGFKHMSLLQVLHKTNGPLMTDMYINESAYTKEDPIKLLNRVQTTFGAIVKREISIVGDKRTSSRMSDIEATFHRVNPSRSAPSCSTVPASSESIFHSMKTTSEKQDQF